jgi:hypothetical protein
VPRHPDKVRLLFGPYTPPPLRKGDRTSCLYRDADVVITGWSGGRISWPRCRELESGSGVRIETLQPWEKVHHVNGFPWSKGRGRIET